MESQYRNPSSSSSSSSTSVVLYQFPVTKLRSWRTGYVRILTIYNDHFATFDPTTTTTIVSSSTSSSSTTKGSSSTTTNTTTTPHTMETPTSPSATATTTNITTPPIKNNNSNNNSNYTMKETNSWSYVQLTEYMAIPNETDTILLQVQPLDTSHTLSSHTNMEQLKFSCGNFILPTNNNNTTTIPANHVMITIRSIVLTVLIRQQYMYLHAKNPNWINPQRYPKFTNVIHSYLTTNHSSSSSSSSNSTSSSSSLTNQSVTLQVLPYGILVFYDTPTNNNHNHHTFSSSSSSLSPQETLLYIDMIAISFPSPTTTTSQNHHSNRNGIYLHFRTMNEVRYYILPDEPNHGRTTLFKYIQEHCVNLGIYHWTVPHTTTTTTNTNSTLSKSSSSSSQQYGLPMIPSMTMETFRSQQSNFHVGPTILSWNVTKVTTPWYNDGNDYIHSHRNSTIPSSAPLSSSSCQLAITGQGYIIEIDIEQHRIRHIRRLCDIYCIIRDRDNTSRFTLEYNDCTTVVSYTVVTASSSRSYRHEVHLRDAVIVSIYDVAHVHYHNTMIHISDIPSSFRYCLVLPIHPSCCPTTTTTTGPDEWMSSSSSSSTTKVAAIANLFQSTPIPQYTLKRLYSIATYIYALISGDFASSQQSVAHQMEHQHYVTHLYQQVECSHTLIDACCEFNSSIPHPHVDFMNPNSTVEKHIIGTMGSLWGIIAKLLLLPSSTTTNTSTTTTTTTTTARPLPDGQRRRTSEQMAGIMFQTLYRLAQTPTGYKNSAELTTLRECLPYLWTIEDTYCTFSAYSVLNVLLSGTTQSMKQRDMETEYVNKNVILKSGGTTMIDGLVNSLLPSGDNHHNDTTTTQGQSPQDVPSDLILMVTSDILQGLLCSYHDTTSPEHFQLFIAALASRYRALLSLLRSSTPFVLENTALLLHLLSTHAPSSTAAIRDAALSSAILLQHFYTATFSPIEGQRFLSRYLCSLWMSGPPNCDEKRLLKRIVPHGFLAFLNMPPLSRMEEDQLDVLERDIIEGNVTDQGAAAAAAALAASNNPDTTIMGHSTSDATTAAIVVVTTAAGGTNTARLRARMTLASNTSIHLGQPMPKENFRVFFHVLTQDHSMADLIWNQQTRRELRIALESELEYIRRETEARGINAIAWNHQQFHVKFPSLDNEVKVGDVYMRLWLQAGDGFIRSWDEPVRLFEHLFRRFLCEVDRDEKVTVMCIRCLERLYAIHAVAIGPFTDISIIIRSMISTRSIETQHRLLGLLATLLGVSRDDKDERFGVADVPENAEQLLNPDSISQLCQFVAWGHTNDVQVGNILSRALGVDIPDKRMITDGTNMNVQGASITINSTSNAPGDWMCPAIWYVTSSGRVPPPPETIRGPYRLSDLQKLMKSGDLSPYDFVTTSCVDEYDMDSENALGQEIGERIDTGKWKRLNQVWQLRWQLCTDGNSSTIYSPSEVAVMALKALMRLVDLHRSLDLRGIPYFPIPTAKRILCSTSRDRNFISDSDDAISSPLPIICQSLLCNDKRIIDRASMLIYKLCEHNERAVSKLYLTGIFFFALSYTGSDFSLLSKLIHATHLNQHFKSGYAAAASESEIPMRDRSIIGNLIPEGLLLLLANYGFERFAEVFVSNADTPEAIWAYDMRKHLIEMIKQHLGDFPLRLFQNNTTEYEYCPMPGVAYKRLEKEIFCHNYYLQNLCDEVRFPDWPICEPVEVFRSCLEQFKKQVNRDETMEEESLEKARFTLNLKTGDGSKELRKSYRALARQFHPDKNPAGRDRFEAIQSSYELLLPLVERGETIRSYIDESRASADQNSSNLSIEFFPSGQNQMQTMSLLIKTQVIICRRYEKEMSRLKYPAYSILVRCISHPITSKLERVAISSEFAKADRASFVLLAVELIFRSCLISPLNSEGLVAENGVTSLATLLDLYIDLIHEMGSEQSARKTDVNLASENMICGIIGFIVRTLAGVSFFQTGRDAMKALDENSKFLANWQRCISECIFDKMDGDELSIRKYALEGIANMAQDPILQEGLIGSGVIWPIIRYTIMYDSTVEDSPTDKSDFDDLGFSMSAINRNARLSIRALGVLSGLYGDGPKHNGLIDLLNILLTPPIAKMLRNRRTDSILQVLNSNVERPDIIWNVDMRKQLEAYVLQQENDRPASLRRSSEDEFSSAELFAYDLLRNELKIGDVYVRQFNKSGKDALVFVESPMKFLKSILNAVAHTLNHAPPIESWVKIGTKQNSSEIEDSDILCHNDFLSAINTLRILCLTDGILDDALLTSPISISSVLFSLLNVPQNSEAFNIGYDTLLTLCSRHIFADEVTRERTLWRLMNVLERPDFTDDTDVVLDKGRAVINSTNAADRNTRGWAVLEGLSSSPSIANYILSTSSWVELLGVLVGYAKFTKSWSARTGAAKTLSRLLWDPNLGSLADTQLKRVLPSTLITRLREDPEDMLKQFDANVDTPELIWDASMRNEVRHALGGYIDLLLQRRTESITDNEPVEQSLFVKYSRLDDEVYIGGVYVARFVKEPTYTLRDPTSFLEQLLQRWAKEIEVHTTDQSLGFSTSDTAIVMSTGPDILELVTTAIVYVCKVHGSLCDKVAGWGYMARSVAFLEKLLLLDKTGSPLLAIIRLLHVCSGRLSNIEALALIGHTDGRQGVVEFIIKAIGKASLHPDAAFMIEFLEKAYTTALGDLDKAHTQDYARTTIYPSLAPSPASGDGPVRKKVSIGDDPLGMMQSEQLDQNHTVNPQVGRFNAVAEVSRPSTMNLMQAPPNSLIAGNVNQYHGYPSQSFSNYQHSQNPQIHPSSVHTVQEALNSTSYQASNRFQSPIPSQTSYQQQSLSSANTQHTLSSQVYMQPQQQHVQNYTSPQSALVTPPINQSLTQQYHQQYQQRQNIAPTQIHHQTQTNERPLSISVFQQQQQRPGQEQHLQKYNQSLDSQMVQNNYNQQHQQLPHNHPSQQQPYGQRQVTTSNQSKAPHPSLPQYIDSGQNHQPQHTMHDRAHFNAHQTPTQNNIYVNVTQMNSGNGTLPQGALPNQTQLHSNSSAALTGSFNTHGFQPHESRYTSPSIQVHDIVGAGSTMASQDQMGLRLGTQQLDTHPMTNQPPPSYKPTPIMEGTRMIDARSSLDPIQVAEQRKENIAGAPNSANGRISWLRQAIATNLCSFLVNDVLENTLLKQIRDPDGAKVHAIAVIKLLRKDPGYGSQFQLILQEIPAWKKYKSQDHSLLITGHEQRADYFLTDGGSGVNKLLTDR